MAHFRLEEFFSRFRKLIKRSFREERRRERAEETSKPLSRAAEEIEIICEFSKRSANSRFFGEKKEKLFNCLCFKFWFMVLNQIKFSLLKPPNGKNFRSNCSPKCNEMKLKSFLIPCSISPRWSSLEWLFSIIKLLV